MKSSSSLGWFVWEVAGGAGEASEETPPSALCLTCCFWSRRSFRKSLAFRHGGRLASAPRPARPRTHGGDQGGKGEKNTHTFQIVRRPCRGLSFKGNKQRLSSCCSENVCFQLFSGFVFFLGQQQIQWKEQREPQSKVCEVQVFFEERRNF